MNIPDNIDFFNAWDAEQERLLERMPVCDYCGDHIQDEVFWLIEGKHICKDCLSFFEMLTEDYADA